MTTYMITRNCCIHGNCDKCCSMSSEPTPYGTPKRIIHMTDIRSKKAAERIAANWAEYKAVVTEEPVKV